MERTRRITHAIAGVDFAGNLRRDQSFYLPDYRHTHRSRSLRRRSKDMALREGGPALTYPVSLRLCPGRSQKHGAGCVAINPDCCTESGGAQCGERWHRRRTAGKRARTSEARCVPCCWINHAELASGCEQAVPRIGVSASSRVFRSHARDEKIFMIVIER